MRQRRRVLSTDESCFTFFHSNGRHRLYRRRRERSADACVDERDRSGNGYVMAAEALRTG